MEIKEFVLQNPPESLSVEETHIIEGILTNPVMKKYLHTLLWSSIRELASIPINTLAEEQYKLSHAYVKGSIGVLTTLGSVERTETNTPEG